MKYILIIITFLFLSGCATTCIPKIEIREVEVPVYINPPAPADIDKPMLPVDALMLGASNDDIAKAYVSSLEIQKIYTKKLELALEPYKNANDDK